MVYSPQAWPFWCRLFCTFWCQKLQCELYINQFLIFGFVFLTYTVHDAIWFLADFIYRLLEVYSFDRLVWTTRDKTYGPNNSIARGACVDCRCSPVTIKPLYILLVSMGGIFLAFWFLARNKKLWTISCKKQEKNKKKFSPI